MFGYIYMPVCGILVDLNMISKLCNIYLFSLSYKIIRFKILPYKCKFGNNFQADFCRESFANQIKILDIFVLVLPLGSI